MTPALKWIGGAFLAGLLLGAVGLGLFGRGQYAALRHFADSTKTASAEQVTAVEHYADSLEHVVTQLGSRRATIITRVRHDTASADTLVLRAAVRSMFEALTISDSMLAAERRSKDSALVVIETLNRSIGAMTAHINRQTGLPKWAKLSLTGVALVGVAYGGYKAGQASQP